MTGTVDIGALRHADGSPVRWSSELELLHRIVAQNELVLTVLLKLVEKRADS